MTIGYICYVDNGPLAEWFEKKYLEWQMTNGRKALDDFAIVLSISRGYLSQLMNGDRRSIGYRSAVKIAKVLDDTTILDILGYDTPEEKINITGYPNMSKMLTEAFDIIRERGIEDDSPEAVKIILETAAKYGVNIKNLSSDQ